jgi:[ribosomal protein S5]-alanine N-acetyltransferase
VSRLLEVETARLRLRPFVADDWRAALAYLSLPNVRRFVPEWPQTEEQAREFVSENAADPRALALETRVDRELVGHIGFHPWFGERAYEIGWAVAPAHQGRGYATEAAGALLAYGFERLGLHRIIATCQPQNTASVRVAEKLGMRREAHFRECMAAPDGSWWDEYFYALLENEWRARSA